MTVNDVHYIGLSIVNGKIVGEHKTIKCKNGHTIKTTTKQEKSEDELCKEAAENSEKAKAFAANARKAAEEAKANAREVEARARKAAEEATANAMDIARKAKEDARKAVANAMKNIPGTPESTITITNNGSNQSALKL